MVISKWQRDCTENQGKAGITMGRKGYKRRVQWVGCLRGEGVWFEWLKPKSRAGKAKGDGKQLEG